MKRRLKDIMEEMEKEESQNNFEGEKIKITFPDGKEVECKALIGAALNSDEAEVMIAGRHCIPDMIVATEMIQEAVAKCVSEQLANIAIKDLEKMMDSKKNDNSSFKEFMDYVAENGTGNPMEDIMNFMEKE